MTDNNGGWDVIVPDATQWETEYDRLSNSGSLYSFPYPIPSESFRSMDFAVDLMLSSHTRELYSSLGHAFYTTDRTIQRLDEEKEIINEKFNQKDNNFLVVDLGEQGEF